MQTIFGIATSSAKLEALISSLETNSVPLTDITVLMPGDPPDSVPPEAAAAQAISDDFSGNPKRALAGGAIGALVGMGVLAVSVMPGLIAIGAGVAAMGAVISCGAGGSMGALIGMGLADSKIEHYKARLKDGARLIRVNVPKERSREFVGLFEREGLEDIAVCSDAAVVTTH
jgi:hypothetical protein